MGSIYTREDLASRLRHLRDRGDAYAFCVGSGLTAPRVPGVSESLKWMQAVVQDSTADRAAFEEAIQGRTGGDAYQAGAAFLLGRRGQETLNGVVRSLVLNAYKPAIEQSADGAQSSDFDEQFCQVAERDLDGWIIPSSVARLADLLIDGGSGKSGLVVTTNFDPLIQIAVRRAGGHAVTEIFDSDGKLGAVDAGEDVLVVHLHGFWQRDDTAHVANQLMRPRESLQASLEDLLRERTMLVTGYSGWDDVFTSALVEAVRRHRAGDLDVLWTFLSEDIADLQTSRRSLFESVGFVPGRVTFFGGIDCEYLFEAMVGEKASEAAEVTLAEKGAFRSPIEGFTAVTPDFLSGQGDLSDADLIRFFDGRIPTWSAAVSKEIPLLESARSSISLLEEAQESRELSLLLLEGPTGEGKSTALRQIASALARRDGWRVLWREEGVDSRVDVSKLGRGDWRWLLVIDEADAVAADCLTALRLLHEQGRNDVQFLLASRTADWRAGSGLRQPWSSFASSKTLSVKGVSEDDAQAIVNSWANAGDAGLGNLAGLEASEQASTFWKAAQEEALEGENSLLGAMLRVRIGDGLPDHVRTLGQHLSGIHLSSGATLLQAFLYVACLHSRQVLSLRPEALAAALALPRNRVYREVVWPLGEEAALTRAASSLMVRHRSIAEVAVSLAADWGEDLAECYYEIIRGTIHAYREDVFIPDLADTVYLPGKLVDEPRVALRAAWAPVEEEPDRLNYWVSLATVMRKVGRAEEGMEIARRGYSNLDSMLDRQGSRVLLYEWAVCAGVTGRAALNAYLAIWSLADEPTPSAGHLERSDLEMATRGLIEALGALARWVDRPWLKDAEEAISTIASHLEGKRAVDEPRALAESVQGAVESLASLAESEWPGEPVDLPCSLSFAQMEKLLRHLPTTPSSCR